MPTLVDRIQGLSGSVAFKVPARAATTENITLNGLQTVDGVTLAAGDRVLVRAQTDATENGIYDANTSDWSRSLDFNGVNDLTKGTLVLVTDGTAYGMTTWHVSTTSPVVGSSLSFSRVYIGSAESVAYLPGGTGAIETDLRQKLRESVSVTDFGALGDDTFDCTASFQAAIDYLLSVGGGKLHIPAGEYWFPAGTKLDPGIGGISFVGDGMDASILHYHEGTTTPAHTGTEHLFLNIDNVTKEAISFSDLQFRGTLNETTRAGRWANPLWLDYYPVVSIDACKFYNIAAEAMDIHRGHSFFCTNSVFESISADGIRVRDTPNCVISGNYIIRNGDDAIAIHTSNGFMPTREGVIVANNHIINAGTIKILGGRVVSVTGNRIELGNLLGISIASDSVEGDNQLRDVVITNNILLDLIAVSTGGTQANTYTGIHISSDLPRGSVSSGDVTPGGYSSTLGAFVYPWDFDDVNTSSADNPVCRNNSFVITGNIIRRTRPSVANFSDYGFGTRLFQGIAYDPAITDANLRGSTGISISKSAENLIISNNIVESYLIGISFGSSTVNYGYRNCVVESNVINNCINRGVLLGGDFSQDVCIKNNVINGDPYREYSLSNVDGTYDSESVPRGVELGDTYGVTVQGNKFMNVCKAISLNKPTKCAIINNTLSCQPLATATGFNAANKGIGVLERASGGFRYEIIDADPTSATYGTVQNEQIFDGVIPTSGTYVQGAFVANISPSIQGSPGSRYVIKGWSRMTTGTAHVAGTDWVEVRTLTGT